MILALCISHSPMLMHCNGQPVKGIIIGFPETVKV